jgi:excisionase family DNA binding protein
MSTANVSNRDFQMDQSEIPYASGSSMIESSNQLQPHEGRVEQANEWPALRIVESGLHGNNEATRPAIGNSTHRINEDGSNKRRRNARQVAGEPNRARLERVRPNEIGASALHASADHLQKLPDSVSLRKQPNQRKGRVAAKADSRSLDTTVDLATRIQSRRKALTVGELAEMLALSVQQVYNLAQRGTIPSMRIASSVRFDPFSTAQWIRSVTA